MSKLSSQWTRQCLSKVKRQRVTSKRVVVKVHVVVVVVAVVVVVVQIAMNLASKMPSRTASKNQHRLHQQISLLKLSK